MYEKVLAVSTSRAPRSKWDRKMSQLEILTSSRPSFWK